MLVAKWAKQLEAEKEPEIKQPKEIVKVPEPQKEPTSKDQKNENGKPILKIYKN